MKEGQGIRTPGRCPAAARPRFQLLAKLQIWTHSSNAPAPPTTMIADNTIVLFIRLIISFMKSGAGTTYRNNQPAIGETEQPQAFLPRSPLVRQCPIVGLISFLHIFINRIWDRPISAPINSIDKHDLTIDARHTNTFHFHSSFTFARAINFEKSDVALRLDLQTNKTSSADIGITYTPYGSPLPSLALSILTGSQSWDAASRKPRLKLRPSG